ncbi:uncharacterized [Tachysurus ichikawai]
MSSTVLTSHFPRFIIRIPLDQEVGNSQMHKRSQAYASCLSQFMLSGKAPNSNVFQQRYIRCNMARIRGIARLSASSHLCRWYVGAAVLLLQQSLEALRFVLVFTEA